MAARAPALVHRVTGRLDRLIGGPARRKVVVTLACVLALDSADTGTVSANATQLQSGLHIGKADIGLLLAVSSLVGAVATLPSGALVDARRRTRLLTIAVALWGVATLISGLATGFVFLVVARIGLGIVVAVAGPAIASLVGDFFPKQDRGRIYGYVLAGELIGAGFGFMVSGQLAVLSWRAPFFALVVPTAGVCWLISRLPEPARGGASRMPAGADRIRSAEDIESGRCEPFAQDDEAPDEEDRSTARSAVQEQDISPRDAAVLRGDPAHLSLWQAVRYVLRVRTNVVLIVASALSYFFFSGVRGFAVEFAKSHYDIGQSAATSLTLVLGIGGLGGMLVGGRLADRLLRKGRLSARLEVPGVAVALSGLIFVPALLVTHVAIATVLLTAASVFLGMCYPPLDAARLDIIHPQLWGRAEAVRTVLRSGGDAAAPLLFGVLAQSVFSGTKGLQYTFLIMLVSLFAASVITLLIGRRSYPSDVAAAAESLRRTQRAER
jgi:MFS family permease